MPSTLTKKRMIITISISLVLLLVVMSLCTSIGTRNISLLKVLNGPGIQPGDNIDYEIFTVRISRVLLSVFVGAALACSGAVLQAILKNPLADPYILGISSGAGLGAMAAIVATASAKVRVGGCTAKVYIV